MWRVTIGDYRDSGRVDAVVYSPSPGFPKPLSQAWSWGWDGNAGVYDAELPAGHPALGAARLCDPGAWLEVYNTGESWEFPVWRGFHAESPDSYPADAESAGLSFAGELGQLSQVTAPRFDTAFEAVGGLPPERQLVELVLAQYNRYTEEGRRISAGRVDTWGLGSLELSDDGTSSTCLDVLTRHFVEEMGGYLYMSYDADGAKLNCAASVDRECSQAVRLGSNMAGFDRAESAVSLSTGVKPMGARLADTPYAGRYFLEFSPQEARPSDWAESYAEHYRAVAFEPLTSEPEGWALSDRDAGEGGMPTWRDYWYYDDALARFVRLGSAGSKVRSRPKFLAQGSDGRTCYWRAKAEDPYALTSLSGITQKVAGLGYTLLDDPPEGFPDGCYVPRVETVRAPYQDSLGEVSWQPAQVLSWSQASPAYVRVASRPAQWLWESGDNYSKYYERSEPVADPVHGGVASGYKAVSKRRRRLSGQPGDWAANYTSYQVPSGDSYKAVPSYSKAGQNLTGFSARKWREGYDSFYRRSFNSRTGVETFAKYEPIWYAVGGANRVYCPAEGRWVALTPATFDKLKSNLWYGSTTSDGKVKGATSMRSEAWRDGWRLDRGTLFKDGRNHARLWSRKPPANEAGGWPADCYVREAPRWGVHAVYQEYVPEFSEVGEVFRAVAPAWRAGAYWAKRAEDAAPGGRDDPREAIWPESAPSWIGNPFRDNFLRD